MLGVPRVDAIGSLLLARRGQGGPDVAGWTAAMVRRNGRPSGTADTMAFGWAHGRVRAVFASASLAIGSDFNASINVGFRNTGLLPLSNGGSSCHELIGGFQTVGVAFV